MRLADVYDIETYQPRKGVGHLLSRVRSELLAALDKAFEADTELSALEISSAQFIVIAALAMAESAKSASDLCKGISYDAGAMTRMIDGSRARVSFAATGGRTIDASSTSSSRKKACAPTHACVRFRWVW